MGLRVVWPELMLGFLVVASHGKLWVLVLATSFYSGEERFILAHGFREFSPWLPGYTHLRRTPGRLECISEENSSLPSQPGSKAGNGQGPQGPSLSDLLSSTGPHLLKFPEPSRMVSPSRNWGYFICRLKQKTPGDPVGSLEAQNNFLL